MNGQSATLYQSTFLKVGDYLPVGSYMKSPCGKYFVVMQPNGNLGVYRGDNPAAQSDYLWGSGAILYRTRPNMTVKGEFYAIMQNDGNFVIYKGPGPQAQGAGVWNSGVTAGGNTFHATIREDGTLAVFGGTDPGNIQGMIWNSGKYFLRPGDKLLTGSLLISPNKSYFAILNIDGEIAVYKGYGLSFAQRRIWNSQNKGTGNGNYYAIFQSDGNLVVEHTATGTLWSSGTHCHTTGKKVTILENGTIAIVNEKDQSFTWTTRNDILSVDQMIKTGDMLVSANHKYYAIMQNDGNFVVYKGSGPDHRERFIWGTSTTATGGTFFALMQGDGNLVVYKGASLQDAQGVMWESKQNQPGYHPYFAIMQDDGNFAIYKGKSLEDQTGLVWCSGGVFEAMTDFDPKEYGFRFPNKFTFDVIGGLITENAGFCGGMCAAALYRYKKHQPAERSSTTPSKGSQLYNELLDRQIKSLSIGVVGKIVNWMGRPDVGHTWDPENSLHQLTKQDWAEHLKPRLDNHQPTLLVLIRTKGEFDFDLTSPAMFKPWKILDIKENHQVLAIGYLLIERTGELTIYVYDPNFSCSIKTITMSLKQQRKPSYSTRRNLRGFFVNPLGEEASK